jgi:hypothetical protein
MDGEGQCATYCLLTFEVDAAWATDATDEDVDWRIVSVEVWGG